MCVVSFDGFLTNGGSQMVRAKFGSRFEDYECDVKKELLNLKWGRICQMIGYNEVYRYSLKYALRMTTKNGFSHTSEY